MGRLGSFLCSPNAHARPIVFLDRRCSWKRAVGSHLAHPEEGRTSKLGRMVGTDLRTRRLAIAAWERGASRVNDLQSNRWVGWVNRVNDCKAIGGLVGGNVCAQGWEGENDDRSERALHPRKAQAVTRPIPMERGTIELGRSILKFVGRARGCADRRHFQSWPIFGSEYPIAAGIFDCA